MQYLIGLCVLLVIICVWALYRLRQMRTACRRRETGEHWDGDFLRQLDAWERERLVKTTERIRISLELNESASQLLNELCEWLGMSRCDVLRNAIVLYHFTSAKRQEGKEVSILVSGEDEETESVDLA